MMLLARACGLPTARVAYQPDTRACLVERYDRERLAGDRIRRLCKRTFASCTD